MAGTATIAKFATSIELEEIPESVVDHAKQHFRDTIGVALAGSTLDIGNTVVAYTRTNAPGDAATLIGRGTASPAGAAFANGVLAHAMEWDDTPGAPHHLSHPSSPTLPAALAAAEIEDATGAALLAGYIGGIEVLSRLERASFPDHYFHGWHDTGTYGVFGAVSAASSILNLTEVEAKHALGIAASCSSGLRKNNGTMAKPFHAGHAAEDGFRAALLAREGFTADTAIFEGHIGYGAVYSPGEYDPTPVESVGEEWDTLEYGYKPFPGITHNHGAQTALLRLVEREDLTPEDVAQITVTLAEAAEDILWVTEPEDPFEAICSIEFNLATILRERGHSVEQYTDAYVTDPETREQMDKVVRRFGFDDPENRDQFSAKLVVETVDGRTFVEEQDYSPLSMDEAAIREKFYTCAETALESDDASRIDEAIDMLEKAGSMDALLASVRTT